MVQVYECEEFDVTKSVVTIPNDVYVMEEFSARITLPIPTRNPAPEITAAFTAPSSWVSFVPVARSDESSSTELVMLVQIKPMEEGNHTLEIHDSAKIIKSVAFTSAKSPIVVFDPQKCSHSITLSNKNCTAAYTDGNPFTSSRDNDPCVVHVARDGYSRSAGRHSWSAGPSRSPHSWSVRIFIPDDEWGYIAFGDTCFTGNRYNPWNLDNCFTGWRSDGGWFTTRTGNSRICVGHTKFSSIQTEDKATLMLDSDSATLELHLHRIMTGMDRKHTLYPTFRLCTPGHRVVFYCRTVQISTCIITVTVYCL